MKNLVPVLFSLILLSACKGKDDTNRDMLYITDTTALNRGYADSAAAHPVVTAPAPPRHYSTPAPRRVSGNSNGTSTSTSNSGTGTTTTTKKGWSKAAKGAVIGGVAGGVAGAIIGKNAKGAIIGGVLGAGGGYIIGRSKDKKDGRVGN